MKKIIIFLMLVGLLSCNLQETETKKQQEFIQIENQTLFDHKIVLNTYKKNNILHCATPYSLRLLIEDHTAKGGWVTSDNYYDLNPLIKPIFTNDYYIKYGKDSLIIRYLDQPLKYVDTLKASEVSMNEELRFFREYMGTYAVGNSKNSLLVCISTNTSYSSYDEYYVIDISSNLNALALNSQQPQSKPEYSYHKVNFLNPPKTNLGYVNYYIETLNSANDKFYISLRVGKTYLVDENYNAKLVIEETSDDVVFFDGFYYAFTRENVYKSVNGINWDLYLDSFTLGYNFDYVTINNKLYCYYGSQIWNIDFKNGSLNELSNSGLEGHLITSINEFYDKIYVSTYSGLFSKDIAEFY